MKTSFLALFSKLQLFFIIAFVICIQTSAASETWEGWRGLEKQAYSKSENTIIEWSTTENVLWKSELSGEGHSSPVVSEKYVFISSANRVGAKTQLGKVMINIFLVCLILIIVYVLYVLFKYLKYNLSQSNISFLNILFTYLLMGIILFSFLTLYWMYFHEKQMMADRKIAYWMFSGAFVSFMFLITVCRITSKNMYRVLLALLILPFIYFLLSHRPIPDYYFIHRLFGFKNTTFVIFILLAVYLPIISIFIFLLKAIFKKTAIQQTIGNNSLRTKVSYPLSFFVFILGFSGLLFAPLITLAKIFYRKIFNGAPVRISINEIFDFTFPYFLIVLGFGFVIWYVIENKQNNTLSHINKWIFPILFCISVGFFVLLNYKTTQILYERAISCYSKDNGELLWKTKGLKAEAVTGSNYNSQATPTPVIKSNNVYAYFGSAGMMCVDFSGELLWFNNKLPFIGLHGVGASPVKSESDIIICNQMPSAPYITAIDAEAGDFRWKNELTKRKGQHGEYRTPMVLSINGTEWILEWYGGNNELRFYNSKNGSLIKKCRLNWRRGGEVIVSPIISGDTLFLTHKLGIHAVSIKKIFSNESPTIWSTKLKAKGPDTSSPVKAGNRIFIVSDNGKASCVDSRNGEILWQERLKGLFYASLVADVSHVYFMDTKSKMTVVENSKVFKIVAQNELAEESSSTPVLVDDKVFIRTSKSLWCLGN